MQMTLFTDAANNEANLMFVMDLLQLETYANLLF